MTLGTMRRAVALVATVAAAGFVVEEARGVGLDGLDAILAPLQIAVDGELVLPDLFGATPTVSDILCNNLGIGSAGVSESGGVTTLALDDFDFDCRAEIALVKDNGDRNDVTVAIGAGSGLSVELETTREVDAQNGDEQLRISACDISLNPSFQVLQEDDPSFFQSFLTGIVNTLARALVPAVSGLVGGLVCTALQSDLLVKLVPALVGTTKQQSAFLNNIQDTQTENKPDYFDFAAFEEEQRLNSRLFSETGDAAIDFTEPLFEELSEFLNRFLGREGIDIPGSLVINQATTKIAEALGDPSGNEIRLDSLLNAMPPLDFEFAGLDIEIGIKKLSLDGLNSFQVFDVLRPNLGARNTLNNKVAMDRLNIDVELDIDVRNTNVGGTVLIDLPPSIGLTNTDELATLTNDENVPVWERPADGWVVPSVSSGPKVRIEGLGDIQDVVSIQLGAVDTIIDAAVTLSVDLDKIEDLPVGGLVTDNIFDALECLSAALFSVQIPTLGLVARVPGSTPLLAASAQSLGGLLEFGGDFVSTLALVFAEGVDIGPLIGGLAQLILNGLLSELTEGGNAIANCNDVGSEFFVETGERDVGEITEILPISLEFLANDFFGVEGDLGINRMISVFTEQLSGTPGTLRLDGLDFRGPLSDFGIDSEAEFDASFVISISDLATVDPNSVFLTTPNQFEVQNTFQLGPPLVIDIDANVSIGPELFADDEPFQAQFNLNLNLGSVGSDSISFIQINLGESFGETIGNFVAESQQCPFQSLSQFAILQMDVSSFLSQVALDVSCTGVCSTTLFDEIGDFLRQQETIDDINAFVSNQIVPFLEQVLEDPETWAAFEQEVLNGPLGDCDFNGDGLENALGVFVGMSVAFLSLGGIGFCSLYTYRIHKRGKAAFEAQTKRQVYSWRQSFVLLKMEKSLLLHPSTTLHFRVQTCLAVLATTALFATGLILSVDTTVAFIISSSDFETDKITPDLTDLAGSLDPNTIFKVLIDGRAFLLAFAIGIFSGVLPFAWVLGVFWCFFVPPTIMTSRRRGKVLLFLSSLGKWTMLYPLFLAILTAAIRVDIAVEDIVGISVIVVPSIGLFLFVVAVIAAVTLNKVVLNRHRSVVERDGRSIKSTMRSVPNQDEFKPSEAVREHLFSHPLGKFRFHACGSLAVLVVGLAIGVFALLGFFAETHQLTLGGVVSGFVEIDKSLSVLDVVAELRSNFEVQDDGLAVVLFGVLAQTAFVFLVLLFPIASALCLCLLWCRPLSFDKQIRLFRVNETIRSISCLEVYVVTVLLVIIQINTTLLQAIIETNAIGATVCGNEQSSVLVEAANAARLTDDVATNCVEIDVVPRLGFGLLVIAALLHIAMYQFVMRTGNAAAEERQLMATGSAFKTDSLFDKDTFISRALQKATIFVGCLAPLQLNNNNNNNSKTLTSFSGPEGSVSCVNPLSQHQALPDGWKQHLDPASGRLFYANQSTGLVTWHLPV